MVGHDYPGSQPIKIVSALAIQESIGYTCYSGHPAAKPALSSFVHFTFQDSDAVQFRFVEEGSSDG
jgi:hypothetical protein